MGDVEPTDLSNNDIGALSTRDYELRNVPAHVGDITGIKGMRIRLT